MSDFQNRAPIAPTAYDDNNWKLWAEGKVDGGNSTPSMKISVVKNQPRLTVYTGRKDSKGQSESIWARMSPMAFFNLLDLLETVARSKVPLKLAMKNEKMIDDRNNPGKKKQITESTTFVGKDDAGICYIAVTAYNKPNIQFPFKPPRFHALLDENGQPANAAVTSAMCALNYVRIHRAMLPVILATNFDNTSQSAGGYQKPSGQQGGGYNKPSGGYNNQGGGGNSYNKPSGGGGYQQSQQQQANTQDNRWQANASNDDSNDDDDDTGGFSQAFGGMKL